ncbi:MAG: serine O-acetyltransferase [Verrucomicrobiota bacterium]
MAMDRSALINELLTSYEEVGGINHIEGANLPSKHTVSEITRTLLRLVFPGFYMNKDATNQCFQEMTQEKLDSVCENLGREVAKSLEFQWIAEVKTGDADAEAQQIVCDFIQQLPVIRQVLRTDVEAAFEGDPAATSFEEIILAYPGLEAITVQRMAHTLYASGIKLIPRMMTEWAHSRTGIDIHPGAHIGRFFFIDHGTGVVIGETCEIGEHVKIYHGVTLGARSTSHVEELRGKKRHPTIEDYVTIYPGATILGGETVIGEGSTVNGNVFLIESVPPHCRVAHEKHALVVTPLKN